MRIVGIGTKSNLWKPTAKQLTLPNWDQSYLEWTDLSGLIIPPFQDGDLRNYKATGTVFGNTDWTIMRDPIDLTGSTIPNPSSYNHDLMAETFRRASNASHPVVQLMIARATDYHNSWLDTLWHTVNDLGLDRDTVLAEWEKALAGHPRLLLRLTIETRREFYPEPMSRTSVIRMKLSSGEVAEDLSVQLQGTDRYIAAQLVGDEVEARHGEPVVRHVHQLDPWPAVKVVAANRVVGDDWWQKSWPA